MDMNEYLGILVSDPTLEHHGILGQKWGVRRFQNKDGSLTAAGRKRVAKLEKQYEKLTGHEVESHARRNIRSMSDQELRDRKNRLQLEDDYVRLLNKREEKGKSKVKSALAALTALGTATSTAVNIYNNSQQVRSIVQKSISNTKKISKRSAKGTIVVPELKDAIKKGL